MRASEDCVRPSLVLVVVAAVALAGMLLVEFSATGLAVDRSLLGGPLLKCQDMDRGIDPFKAAWVRMRVDERNIVMGRDACYGPGQVYEFYCLDGSIQTMIVDCPPGSACHEGLCVWSGKV